MCTGRDVIVGPGQSDSSDSKGCWSGGVELGRLSVPGLFDGEFRLLHVMDVRMEEGAGLIKML